MKYKKISVVFGTRPEAIKLAPVINELKNYSEFTVNVCVTAQHRDMLDQVLEVFEIKPDVDLNIMKPNQTLADLSANSLRKLDQYFLNTRPDLVIVQGDTTTTFITSLAAFYNKIDVAHVEAGLRTFNRYSPFPEELNRTLTSRLTTLHFAPTEKAKINLINEGIAKNKIFVTGNTVIDALLSAMNILEVKDVDIPGLSKEIEKEKIILITGHRRENFGEGFQNICEAIAELADKYYNISFVYPVHLNPNVQKPVNKILGNKKNVYLIKPLNYLPFIKLMKLSHIILTDSGGIQEEAPSLGKPVLVMREFTERPEAVAAGCVELVGTNKNKIISKVTKILMDEKYYRKMEMIINPYGDGKAAKRILDVIKNEI